ncbi:IS3 family transposase [Pectinatus frisingensis]
MFKTEFVQRGNFENLCQLCQEIVVYLTWFNTQRIHG